MLDTELRVRAMIAASIQSDINEIKSISKVISGVKSIDEIAERIRRSNSEIGGIEDFAIRCLSVIYTKGLIEVGDHPFVDPSMPCHAAICGALSRLAVDVERMVWRGGLSVISHRRHNLRSTDLIASCIASLCFSFDIYVSHMNTLENIRLEGETLNCAINRIAAAVIDEPVDPYDIFCIAEKDSKKNKHKALVLPAA